MTLRVGLIARVDSGGLGQMATEFARGYRPHAALIIDFGKNSRGVSDYDRVVPYVTEHWVSGGQWDGSPYRFPTDADLFFDACDVIVAQETVYDRRSYTIAHGWGKGLVLHAMPEFLAPVDAAQAPTLWLPTPWHADAVTVERIRHGRPAPIEVPVPLVIDDWEYRQRRTAEVFCLIPGEAQHDRNGLQAVWEALPWLQRPALVYLRGGPPPYQDRWQEGKVTVQWLPEADDYHDVIPDDVDVLLQPRRYGGLSMPVREAAARGIPTIMTDLDPQNAWPACPAEWRIPTSGSYKLPMKGGVFDIATIEYRDTVATLEHVLDTPAATVADYSARAREWAEALSWDVWRPVYDRELERAADQARIT